MRAIVQPFNAEREEAPRYRQSFAAPNAAVPEEPKPTFIDTINSLVKRVKACPFNEMPLPTKLPAQIRNAITDTMRGELAKIWAASDAAVKKLETFAFNHDTVSIERNQARSDLAQDPASAKLVRTELEIWEDLHQRRRAVEEQFIQDWGQSYFDAHNAAFTALLTAVEKTIREFIAIEEAQAAGLGYDPQLTTPGFCTLGLARVYFCLHGHFLRVQELQAQVANPALTNSVTLFADAQIMRLLGVTEPGQGARPGVRADNVARSANRRGAHV